jgi:predicted GNAT family acetyltransferase
MNVFMKKRFDDRIVLIVTPNSSANRFETTIAGRLARVECRMSDNRMIITHTEVHEALRGKGVGQKLLTFAVKYAQKKGLEVVAECGYANWFLNRDATLRRPEEGPQNPDG